MVYYHSDNGYIVNIQRKYGSKFVIKPSKIQNRATLHKIIHKLLGFQLQLPVASHTCEMAHLPLWQHMASLVRYTPWLRAAEILHLVETTAKARGSVSADVREMLGEHSMTKTDGLKNRSSWTWAPLPRGPGVSSMLKERREGWGAGRTVAFNARESTPKTKGAKLNCLLTITRHTEAAEKCTFRRWTSVCSNPEIEQCLTL